MRSQHTSAALTINENYDSGQFPNKLLCGWTDDQMGCVKMSGEVSTHLSPEDVHRYQPRSLDMDMALDNIVPESLNWRHTDEGPEWVLDFLLPE